MEMYPRKIVIIIMLRKTKNLVVANVHLSFTFLRKKSF